jgi:hypothetical protein
MGRADLATGEYTLRAGLYERNTAIRAPVTGVDSVESSVVVGKVSLVAPTSTSPVTEFSPGIEAFVLKGPQQVVDAVSDLGLGWLKQQVL